MKRFVLPAMLILALPAHAQSVKWLRAGVPFCQNKHMIQCKQISTGKVQLVATDFDTFNREIFLVNYDGVEGYISAYFVEKFTSDEDPAITSVREKAKATAAKKECDRRGGVSIGMTADQVRASCWGKPERINQTITARGKHEQWIYGRSYVYLENGTVTSIQTSR